MLDYRLQTLNIRHIKRKGKLWKHILRLCGMKTQIDYTLIKVKRENSALNCEAYNTFFTVASDHTKIEIESQAK